MNARRLEAVMSQDGQLLLSGLPFLAGDTVEVIVLAETSRTYGSVGAESQEDTAMMEEWGSDADEAAYQNLQQF